MCAALLRKAEGGDFLLSSEVGRRPLRGPPKGWLADGHAVAAHGCGCAPAEPRWADAEYHRRPRVHELLDSISQVGFVAGQIDAIAVEIGNEEVYVCYKLQDQNFDNRAPRNSCEALINYGS